MEQVICKVKRQRSLFLIGGTFCIDLDDISCIIPPFGIKPKGFDIILKSGNKIQIPYNPALYEQWLSLTLACTQADLQFVGNQADNIAPMGMTEAMFIEFQRVGNPFETYTGRERP